MRALPCSAGGVATLVYAQQAQLVEEASKALRVAEVEALVLQLGTKSMLLYKTNGKTLKFSKCMWMKLCLQYQHQLSSVQSSLAMEG